MAEKPDKFMEGVGITPQWMEATAEKWIEENRDIWKKMLTVAANYVAQGRRFSMETLIQFARYDYFRYSSSWLLLVETILAKILINILIKWMYRLK